MSLWQKLFGGGEPSPANSGAAGGTPGGEVSGGDLPYGIDQRPMPEGEDPDVLLPPQVGSYIREPVKTPSRMAGPLWHQRGDNQR
jgi:hypothetical protein